MQLLDLQYVAEYPSTPMAGLDGYDGIFPNRSLFHIGLPLYKHVFIFLVLGLCQKTVFIAEEVYLPLLIFPVMGIVARIEPRVEQYIFAHSGFAGLIVMLEQLSVLLELKIYLFKKRKLIRFFLL